MMAVAPAKTGQLQDRNIRQLQNSIDQSHILTVTDDGNYGAGKSSLIRQMAEMDGVMTFIEPVAEEWHEVLTSTKRNPKEYTFQKGLRVLSHFMNVGSKIKEMNSLPPEERPHVVIVERNARNQLLVVQQIAKEHGFVDDEQMDVM